MRSHYIPAARPVLLLFCMRGNQGTETQRKVKNHLMPDLTTEMTVSRESGQPGGKAVTQPACFRCVLQEARQNRGTALEPP